MSCSLSRASERSWRGHRTSSIWRGRFECRGRSATRAGTRCCVRADLSAAAAWLQDHQPLEEPIVVCHGDLHPFNVLVDDVGVVTVLDWSAALLTPASYDVAFTSLVLAEPPLLAPKPLRPLIRSAGRALSRRFVRAYERAAGRPIDRTSLQWHQAVVCLRALVEVAAWVTAGTIHERGGHPWVIAGPAFAGRLRTVTGAPVTPR